MMSTMSNSFPGRELVFVYGTLKTGGTNYPYWIADQVFVTRAITTPKFPLFVAGPGMNYSPCLMPRKAIEQAVDRVVTDTLTNVRLLEEGKQVVAAGLRLYILDTVRDVVQMNTTAASSSAHNSQESNHSEGQQVTAEQQREVVARIINDAAMVNNIEGEVFAVTPECLATLDVLEGCSNGVYQRSGVEVQAVGIDGAVNGSTMRGVHGYVRVLYEPAWVEELVVEAMQLAVESRNATSTAEVGSAAQASSEPLPRRQARFVNQYHHDSKYLIPHFRPNSTLRPPVLNPSPIILVIIDGVGDSSSSTTMSSLSTPTPVCPGDEKKGLTPLQVARIPVLDALARGGVNGLMDPCDPGMACGSDTAHLSIFGYDPKEFYRGRGSFEAMGAGLEMVPGDIAFKCNFATMDAAAGVVVRRRCDRSFEAEGPVLCAALTEPNIRLEEFPNVRVFVRYATEHRCGVVVRELVDTTLTDSAAGGGGAGGLSDRISGTDPLRDNLPLVQCSPVDEKPSSSGSRDAMIEYAKAERTSRIIMAVHKAIQQILVTHPINAARIEEGKPPANVVLLRGAGMATQAPDFLRRHGLNGFLVAPTCIIKGLGISLGLDSFDAPGATGDYGSNYEAKARTVLSTLAARGGSNIGSNAHPGAKQSTTTPPSGQSTATAEELEHYQRSLQPYTFAVLHVKGVDDAGHDGMFDKKVELLERLDAALSLLVNDVSLQQRTATIAVIADHSTAVAWGDHSAEPVPVCIHTLGHDRAQVECVRDGVECYDELAAAGGALGRFHGKSFMDLLTSIHHANQRLVHGRLHQ